MLSQVLRYYHTLRYLHWIQIRYRIFYQLKKKSLPVALPAAPSHQAVTDLHLAASVDALVSWLGEDTFCFLNVKHHFENGIDWNCAVHGKLWTYNLNYFEFLSQPGISKYEGLGLIHDFIGKSRTIKDGMEPFPISLRVIFWIKFLLQHQIQEPSIDQSLLQQVRYLSAHPEYHLLGNHLLENGFALLFGACYFEDDALMAKAREILLVQIPEQILDDGGHFELSPMYHQLMLYRLLDAINLLQNNPKVDQGDLLHLLHHKAALMLGWLDQMTFANGDMPLLNDSAPGIAPNRQALKTYARRLHLLTHQIKLGQSGYRKFIKKKYELLADVGAIGPDYIPGHAHSDTFNFILYYQQQPLLVDTGISTYEKNDRRHLERSTRSHNTVMLDREEQSEVWGGFRVARRAKIIALKEATDFLQASHDGYQKINAIHQRTFELMEDTLVIKDTISSDKVAKAFFHFHPDIHLQLIDREIQGTFGSIQFGPLIDVSLDTYFYAHGFNHTEEAQKVIVRFRNNLQTQITLL